MLRQARPLIPPLLGVLALMLTFVVLFLTAFHDPKPNGLEVAVAGPPAAAGEVQAAIDRAGIGEIELVRAGSPEAARRAVLKQDAQAALLLDTRPAQLLVATAASPFAALALEGALTRAGAAAGEPLRVQDIRPLPEDDSKGLSSVFLSIGVTVPSFLLGAMLWALGGALPARAFAGLLAGFGIVAGLLAALAADAIVGTISGAFWPVSGLLALLVVAVAATVAGLGRIAGPPGVALGALFLLLSLASSGGPVGPLMIPDFYSVLGHALPTGATMTAIRDTVYFDGEQTLVPVLVLVAWAAAGALMWAVGRRRGLPAHRRAPLSAVQPTTT